ncbi:MAG: TIGR03118 family protein [Ilumatobacteraceae bacterium]
MRIPVTATVVALLSGTALAGHFEAKVLVSNQPGVAPHTDGNLVNAWGLAASPTGPWWVADNHSGLATLYGADGTPLSLVVMVPGAPTGEVFSNGTDLLVSDGTTSAPSVFLFASEDGTISGWAPTVPASKLVPPPPSTQAFVVVDRSKQHAIYKGLALARTRHGDARLYATDFHNARVDVFDGSFNRIRDPFAFRDPWLPHGYAPFGIAVHDDRVFVTYAKQGPGAEDDEKGPGHGFIDEYTLDGWLIRRVASRGALNSPWGLAWAPDDFGRFEHTLLVGNFGDGKIHGYRWRPWGEFDNRGALRDADRNAIVIDGLWALKFGNDHAAGPSDTLFFTAGPNDEEDGAFGSIVFVGPDDDDD